MKLLVGIALVFAFLWTGHAASNTGSDFLTTCDPGWTYYKKNCYSLNNEYLDFDKAAQSCAVLGGFLAYAPDKDTLTFLKQLVAKQTNYAWWYGMYYQGQKQMVTSPYSEKYYTPRRAFPVPALKVFTAPVSGCVGMSSYSTALLGVPCRVTLPYICRGDPKSVSMDSDHYAKNSSVDVYWFSSPTDRLSYQDASNACKAKSMTLLSIRDKQQSIFLSQQIIERSQGNIDPWWIGMSVNGGNVKWTDGVTLNDDALNWNYATQSHSNRYRLLLSEGTLEMKATGFNDYNKREWHYYYAPYICMKEQQLTNDYGCPVSWVRADQSCYRIVKTRLVLYETAQHVCSKAGASLVSVNSVVEKTWLTSNHFNKYGTSLWTSLKNNSGDLVWADGTKPNPNVVTWQEPLSGTGNCVYLGTRWLNIHRGNCVRGKQAGCQYTPSNGKCVSDSWYYYKGKCYFLPSGSYKKMHKFYTPYDTNMHVCNMAIAQYDSSIDVQPLKVDSLSLAQALAKKSNSTIWLGLQMGTDGTFKWTDGTNFDVSLAEQIAKVSNYHAKCATLDSDGTFYKTWCQDCYCGYTACEKKVPYPSSSSSSTSLTSPMGTLLLMTLFTSFISCILR